MAKVQYRQSSCVVQGWPDFDFQVKQIKCIVMLTRILPISLLCERELT